jgi:hypothetical protein
MGAPTRLGARQELMQQLVCVSAVYRVGTLVSLLVTGRVFRGRGQGIPSATPCVPSRHREREGGAGTASCLGDRAVGGGVARRRGLRAAAAYRRREGREVGRCQWPPVA